jgi:prolyl-tRNA synthetase
MDLIGIPIRITVGKKIEDNLVELKLRNNSNYVDKNTDEIINYIEEYIKNTNK